MISCLFLYGASYDNYIQFEFYKKSRKYRNSFITKTRTFKLMHQYEDSALISKFLQKDVFNEMFAKYIHRGWMTTKKSTIKETKAFIEKYGEVIVKPLDSSKGIGVKLVKAEELNNPELIEDLKSENLIIEEKLVNCDEIRALCPNSLNTIRIVTFMDKNHKVHVLASNLRMGNGTHLTDNICTGGIGICIDRETGTLAEYGRNVKAEKFAKHPLSGITFKGYKIPRVQEGIDLVTKLAQEEVPTLRIIGWDVVITPDGVELLEANVPPGEEMTEYDLKGKWHFVKANI